MFPNEVILEEKKKVELYNMLATPIQIKCHLALAFQIPTAFCNRTLLLHGNMY